MELAKTLAQILAPFTPYLLDEAKAAGEAFVDAVARHGGREAWDAAKKLWSRCRTLFTGDKVVDGALDLLTHQPDQEAFHAALAVALEKHFEAHPEHARVVEEEMKEPGIAQVVRATGRGKINTVEQDAEGIGGSQTVEAHDDAHIGNVKQRLRGPD